MTGSTSLGFGYIYLHSPPYKMISCCDQSRALGFCMVDCCNVGQCTTSHHSPLRYKLYIRGFQTPLRATHYRITANVHEDMCRQ